MTQEEKAKAYDEALERAKKYNIDDAHAYQGTIVKLIFPELRESEDERIRKALIQEFKEKVQKSFEWKDGIPNNAVLNWLEKQKEPLPIPDKFSGLKSLMLQYLQSAANRKDDSEIESDTDLWGRKILDYVWKYSDEQKEQKPASTEDMPYITDEHFYEREPVDSFKYKLAEYMTKCCTKKEGSYGYEYGISAETILKMAEEELLKRGVVQKPAEWSAEDEEMLDAMIDIVSNSLYEPLCPREGMLAWLKSLPERFNLEPKQEWNEEDEKTFWELTAYIPNEELKRLGVTRLDILRKLKSLRPQSKVECSEGERIRKELIFFLKEEIPQCSIKEHAAKLKEFVSYLEKQKEPNLLMIQWTGNNLKEVIEFTGKSDKFEKWFKSWDEYEAYVRDSGNILKLFCEGDDHYKVPVGAWIIKTPDGHNIPSCFEFVHNPDEIDENKIIKKHITEDVLSSEVNKRLKECGWYVTDEKPAEWSDEDERMLNSILKTLQDEYHDLCNDKYGHEEIISDLKSSCRKKMSWLEALTEKFGIKK